MSEPSWEQFSEQAPVRKPVEDDKCDNLCARVFSTRDGEALLVELRKKYFDAPFNPLADEAALRVRSAQQHFILQLELACQRGLKASARPKN